MTNQPEYPTVPVSTVGVRPSVQATNVQWQGLPWKLHQEVWSTGKHVQYEPRHPKINNEAMATQAPPHGHCRKRVAKAVPWRAEGRSVRDHHQHFSSTWQDGRRAADPYPPWIKRKLSHKWTPPTKNLSEWPLSVFQHLEVCFLPELFSIL